MTNVTEHGQERLQTRLKTYLEKLGRAEKVVTRILDKGHDNGLERHVVHRNRLVYIYNVHTRKFITVLYARDGQLKRYGLDPKDFPKFIPGLNHI